jgi:predicted acyl esterase
VPMRDGVRLFVNLYWPSFDGRYPIIMSVTPYGKDKVQIVFQTPRDLAEAAKWTLKAANQGNPIAQTDIGYAYYTGSQAHGLAFFCFVGKERPDRRLDRE